MNTWEVYEYGGYDILLRVNEVEYNTTIYCSAPVAGLKGTNSMVHGFQDIFTLTTDTCRTLNSHLLFPLTYTKSHEKRHSHTVTQHRFCFHSLTTGIQYWGQCGLFPMVRHTVSGSRYHEI